LVLAVCLLTCLSWIHLTLITSYPPQPKLKSEEPSAEDLAKPVKVIKGKSFKKEVVDSKKDVLLEFYAPWWYVLFFVFVLLCCVSLVVLDVVMPMSQPASLTNNPHPNPNTINTDSGHCKSLEPKYDTLAEKFEKVDHITIAKIDYTVRALLCSVDLLD
jgi:thiol-disulfide isomerase/thioredoxin